MSEIKITMSGTSIIGDREYQEDSFYANEQEHIAVVCDGMGGLSGGNIASRCAVDIIRKTLTQKDITKENIRHIYREAAMQINERINLLEDSNGQRLESGTTMVVADILDGNLYWMSVGDSKLYLIRKGKIICLTREHNYKLKLDEYLKNGYIDQKDYYIEMKKSEALISYLGIRKLELIDTNEIDIELNKEDILLLCSDGLYKAMSDMQILAVVEENQYDIEYCVRELMNMSKHLVKGKQDNTTAIVIRCE